MSAYSHFTLSWLQQWPSSCHQKICHLLIAWIHLSNWCGLGVKEDFAHMLCQVVRNSFLFTCCSEVNLAVCLAELHCNILICVDHWCWIWFFLQLKYNCIIIIGSCRRWFFSIQLKLLLRLLTLKLRHWLPLQCKHLVILDCESHYHHLVVIMVQVKHCKEYFG